MREISPAKNLSAEECFAAAPPQLQEAVRRIRSEKDAGTRRRPSATLLDQSSVLTPTVRRDLLDRVAALVDENLFGRSEMCLQFADLLSRALQHLGLDACVARGTAIYRDRRGRELLRWQHAWVRVVDEVIDGNVDVLDENPFILDKVKLAPFWGPAKLTPPDRQLRQDHQAADLEEDDDVVVTWWPDLRRKLG